MKRYIRSKTFIIDNAGWYENANSYSLPIYRDDGVFICHKPIGKKAIISKRPCGVGQTAFEIEDWLCKKVLSPGYTFGLR